MTYVLSKSDQALIRALEKGWTVDDNGVCRRCDSSPQKVTRSAYGYLVFRVLLTKRHWVFVHRLAALQRFGAESLFARGVVVRHLDNNKLNNSVSNIAVGSYRDNARDNPDAVNARRAQAAAAAFRTFNENEIRSILERVAGGESQRSVARDLGVSHHTIGNICRGCSYAEVTGKAYAARKSNAVGRKLTDEQARQLIIDYRTTDVSHSELVKRYGISKNAVSLLIQGRSYGLATAEVRARFINT